ncbi:Transcription termination factor, mitochondrial/chloroplastic [Dillenia turbinata]|uniref:Transcription termination factor, mitochondrial/chloroplastic n=1 Tax=Dillenia turbinata TaxID=194707 RepID=A0AAN8V6Y2_9MAGN
MPLLKFVSVEALHRRILSPQSVGIEEIEGFDKRVRLLVNHGIPKEQIVHVLSNVNLDKATCLKSVEEIEEKIAFLNRFGGCPWLLNYDLETRLIPRIEVLLELSGGDENTTGDVLPKLPAVLSYSVEHLESHIEFFVSYAGLTDPEIFKLVLVFPNVFRASRKRKLLPRIEFLKQCALNSDDVFKFLVKAPLFSALSFEDNLSCKLIFLVKIGYMYRTKEWVTAMGAVTWTSCENLHKEIGLLLNNGFSREDIVVIARNICRYHRTLCYKLDERIKHSMKLRGEHLEKGCPSTSS